MFQEITQAEFKEIILKNAKKIYHGDFTLEKEDIKVFLSCENLYYGTDTVNSLDLSNNKIKTAESILVLFEVPAEYSLKNITSIMQSIHKLAIEEAAVMFALSTQENQKLLKFHIFLGMDNKK